MNFWRFQYHPPWHSTKPFKFLIESGCDEWHNSSKLITLPGLGMVVVFYGKFDRAGEQHIWYLNTKTYAHEGRIDLSCDACLEFYTSNV